MGYGVKGSKCPHASHPRLTVDKLCMRAGDVWYKRILMHDYFRSLRAMKRVKHMVRNQKQARHSLSKKVRGR